MGGIRRLVLLTVVVTALIAVTVLAWLPFSSIYLDPSNAGLLFKTFSVLGAAFLIVTLVRRRVRDDHSRPANLIRRLVEKAVALLSLLTLAIPFGFCFGIFICLASATDRPMADAELAAIDRMIGFDWLAFLVAANSNMLASSVLVFAYHSVAAQTFITIAWHTIMHRFERLFEFNALMVVSLAITGLIMALVPAGGAYTYFQPTPEMFDNFTSEAGMWHYAELMRLRSGEPVAILVSEAKPLVTFPSFHTALGILIVYSVRGTRMLVIPAAVLNSLMIVATIPEGGHHFIDVVAGTIVALASIAIIRLVNSYEPGRVAVQRMEMRPRRLNFQEADSLPKRVVDDCEH